MYSELERKLIKLAYKNIYKCNGRSRHISFLLNGKKIESIGFNSQIKTHTLCHKHNYWKDHIHSEVHAVIKCKRIHLIDGFSLWNIRIDRHGNIRISKPCDRCMEFIKKIGIKKVYYTKNNGEFACLKNI